MIPSLSNQMRRVPALAALSALSPLLLGFALGACSSNAPAAGTAKVSVVTTIYPLEFLARRIGGDRVDVVNMVPPGVEPHDWEPSPKDIAAIQRAHVFIENGAGFEPWAARVVRDLPKSGPLVLQATDGLPLMPPASSDGEEGVASGGLDPHVWLSLALFAFQAEQVKNALTKADPAGAQTYAANLDSLKAQLAALSDEMKRGLSSCAQNTIVTSHAAFGYLAKDLGLRQVFISGLSPEAEPSPARLRELIAEVKQLGVNYIFFETLVSPAVAKTLAREVGAKTLTLNPLEGLTSEEVQAGQDYLTVMRSNLQNLRLALECR
ncbi:MAG: ABC transporter substrate-binding protein [Dehalococcoidia bacterium]|nr:ABC transporter substrate-binding protein [Dehalococcoidia bacterium]